VDWAGLAVVVLANLAPPFYRRSAFANLTGDPEQEYFVDGATE
jgi:hypothetical protein